MKVLMLAHKFWPSKGGTQTQVYNLAKELRKRGHQVTVLTSLSEGLARRESVEGVQVERFERDFVRLARPGFVTSGMAKAALAKAKDCDIVHGFNFITFQSLLGSLIKSIEGRPFVLTPAFHPWMLTYDMTLGAKVMRSADLVLAQCEQERERMESLVPPERIALVPCGVDREAFSGSDAGSFRSTYGLEKRDKVVLYVGPMSGHKSLRFLIEGFPTVVREVPQAKLVMIGGGSREGELKDAVSRMGLQGSVKMLGRVPDQTLLAAYSEADVFAFPSEHESFGIALLEAAASGLPIVSTRVGIAPEIVRSGSNGFVLSRLDQRFPEALVKVLMDPSYSAIASEGRRDILEQYDWGSIVVRLEGAYERACAR